MHKAALGLLLSVITMVVIGIVMLFSTGAYSSDSYKKVKKPVAAAVATPGTAASQPQASATPVITWDPAFLLKRQLMWLCIGIVGCIAAACIDYHRWQKGWKYWFGAAVLLLLAVYFTPKINGSHRWLKAGPFSFQPSEIGKIAVVAFLAAWYSKYAEQSKQFLKGLAMPLGIVGALTLLIAGEPDLGTTALIGGTTLFVIFVAGASLWYILPLPILGTFGIIYIAMRMPERLSRLTAFLDLERYKDGAGGQQFNGLIALGSGGVEGLGLGMGRQKMQFLPFAHTDFIFPMIGEELGLRFTLLIVFCYVLLIVCGIAISLNSKDRFGMLLGFGIVVLIALQAAMNIGVTTALLPNKGITLPFISYGGSSLVFCLMEIGILLNIYRQGLNEHVVRANTKRSGPVAVRI